MRGKRFAPGSRFPGPTTHRFLFPPHCHLPRCWPGQLILQPPSCFSKPPAVLQVKSDTELITDAGSLMKREKFLSLPFIFTGITGVQVKHVDSGSSDSDPHTCVASGLPTEPLPRPLNSFSMFVILRLPPFLVVVLLLVAHSAWILE